MDLKQLKKGAEIGISLIKNTSDLEKWRIKYLGRKSILSLFFNSLSKLIVEVLGILIVGTFIEGKEKLK